MPYTNIHWIKIKLEILQDKRFLFDLNDNQKLLFISLLMLAGATKNKVPDDENFLKNRLNLSENTENIRKNMQKIFEVFPKTITKDGVINFKNFNKLHNPIRDVPRNSEGTPKDAKRRVDIEKIIEEYIKKKKFVVINEDGSKNKEIISALYKRNCRTAKQMLILTQSKIEPIIKAMNWFGDFFDSKNLSWTLETIEKWLPEYISKGESIAQAQLRKDFGLK